MSNTNATPKYVVTAAMKRQLPILINDYYTLAPLFTEATKDEFWAGLDRLEAMGRGEAPWDNGIHYTSVTLPNEPSGTPTYKVYFTARIEKTRSAKVCITNNLQMLNHPQVRTLDDPHFVQFSIGDATKAEVEAVYNANQDIFTEMRIEYPKEKQAQGGRRTRKF